MSNTAPQLSRHLGDYLLVAPLSDDALGSVFRALHAADERRFVRLRILRTSELSAEAIEAAILENASRRLFLAHPAIVDRTVLDIVDGVPFMTWDETSGWTLDAMLSRVRAYGIRIPAEYALLIAERLAAALEHAHRTESGGRAVHHGLLWPGFVSISHDAAVRVGGFGLAEAILPSLSQPRLAAEVAPYLAPESRLSGVVDPTADVYALGMILSELLTGRRPTVDGPLPELRAGDPRSDELETFLHRCLAPRETRFASAVDAHREIQRMVTGNPFSLYTANLALFLYKLLNPESQLAAPSSDWESTNPVVLDPSATVASRREAAVVFATPAAEAAAPVEPVRRETKEPEVEAALQAVAAEANAILTESEDAEVESAIASIQPVELVSEADRSVVVFRFDQETPLSEVAEQIGAARPELADAAPGVIPRQVTASPFPLWASAWTRPAGALAAAAGLTLGAFLLVSQFAGRSSAPASPDRSAQQALATAEPTDSQPVSAAARAPEIGAAAPVAVLAGPGARFETVATRPGASRPAKPAPALSRQPAENLRLRAALARIEAGRLNAQETAGDLFGEGRHNEEEGERLLRQHEYPAAELAFSRAARLFQKAQEISWERRLRESDLSSAQ